MSKKNIVIAAIILVLLAIALVGYNIQKQNSSQKQVYVVPLGGISLAVPLDYEDGEYLVPDSDVRVIVAGDEQVAYWGDVELPGYYETISSWESKNQNTGIILPRN
jgi:hypothetical protein